MSDIMDTIRQFGFFKTLTDLVDSAGLDEAFKKNGPLTIFAPTDQAFAKLGAGTVEDLLRDPPRLRLVLVTHVIRGKLTFDEAILRKKAVSVVGQDLHVHRESDGVYIDLARVIEADLEADNGLIHAIDKVLLPSTVAQASQQNKAA